MSDRAAVLERVPAETTQGPTVRAVSPRTGRKKVSLGIGMSHAVLLVGALAMLMPFGWQILTSLKTYPDSIRVPLSILPAVWDWRNYAEVFEILPFGTMFLNTLWMTIGRTVAQLVFCSMAAYAFARLRFPGRNLIFYTMLAVLMVPVELFLLPQYLIMSELGWLNTIQALIVPGMFNVFNTFLLRQYFLTLPRELEEAAKLDGCNPLQTFLYVLLPLVKPAMVTVAVLTILYSWNELMWPLIVNSSRDSMTLSVGLATLQGDQITDYPVIMAGSLMATLPILIAFVLLQKQVVAGIATSGLKG
jgi:multiple sugar transport system permease protein